MGVQYSQPIESSYIARCIQKLHVVLVASPSYLAKHGSPKCPADLANHNCINVELSSGKVMWRLISNVAGKADEHIHEPSGNLYIYNHFEALMDAAVGGLGISIADPSSTLPLLETGKLRVVLPDYHVVGTERGANSVMMIYPHRKYVPLRVRLFMKFLKSRGEEAALPRFDPHEFAD